MGDPRFGGPAGVSGRAGPLPAWPHHDDGLSVMAIARKRVTFAPAPVTPPVPIDAAHEANVSTSARPNSVLSLAAAGASPGAGYEDDFEPSGSEPALSGPSRAASSLLSGEGTTTHAHAQTHTYTPTRDALFLGRTHLLHSP